MLRINHQLAVGRGLRSKLGALGLRPVEEIEVEQRDDISFFQQPRVLAAVPVRTEPRTVLEPELDPELAPPTP